jgi:hypothetical protein
LYLPLRVRCLIVNAKLKLTPNHSTTTTLSVGSISGFDFSTVKTSLTDDTEKNNGVTSDSAAVHDFSVLIGSFILPPDDMIQMSEPVPLFGLDFTKAQPDEVDMYGYGYWM